MKVDQASFPFAPSGFFALRTPLLPFDEFLALGWGLEGLSLDEEVAALRVRLTALVAKPAVREALFVASPSLAESFPAWKEAPEGERGQKVELALLRYFQRMAGRSTPFGLFAGCTTAVLGPRTELTLAPRETHRRHTRLDMDYLCALVDALVADPARRTALRFRTSSSLYPVAEQLRYVEPRIDPATRERSYFLSAVEPSPELRFERFRLRSPASASSGLSAASSSGRPRWSRSLTPDGG